MSCAFRFPWEEDTIVKYSISLGINVYSGLIYCAIAYSHLGIMVGSFFYFECFIEDIRHSLSKLNDRSVSVLNEQLISIVEFHLLILR